MRYVSITKPGIVFGNIVTVSGGFFLGCHAAIPYGLLLLTLIGMCFVVGGGCVLNNFIDRDIDQLMERTKNRPTAVGSISGFRTILFGVLLSIVGFFVLALWTNWLTVIVALVGFVVYVGVYSLCLKRKSTMGTTIGGIAGAVPPVVGYTAATNHFDLGAVILFLILFFWQMPHFYAIAIYRLKDFAAAGIPVLPIKKSVLYTKRSILAYIVFFTLISITPSIFGYTGIVYLVVALILGIAWFFKAYQGFNANDDRIWAKRVFLFSIIVITVLSMMMLVKQ